jgi:hypothetical protein
MTSARVATFLEKHRYRAFALKGGYMAWLRGLPRRAQGGHGRPASRGPVPRVRPAGRVTPSRERCVKPMHGIGTEYEQLTAPAKQP